jgi:heme oxygenase
MHTARPFPPTKTDLLERLRSATQDVHLQIERSVRFLDPDATVNDYRDYLARLFGYVAPLEDRLAAVCGDAPDLEVDARRKAHLAVIDLRALGLPLYEIGRLPRCAALPDVSNLQRALGCLYVLEGSTLGGRTRTFADTAATRTIAGTPIARPSTCTRPIPHRCLRRHARRFRPCIPG